MQNPTFLEAVDTFRRALAADTDKLVGRQRRKFSPTRANLIKERQELYDRALKCQLELEKGRGQ